MVCVLKLSSFLIVGLELYCRCSLLYVDLMVMIETTIVPIVKNKCGNITDSNTYRPIALSTIVSKLFESVLLLKCVYYITTSLSM